MTKLCKLLYNTFVLCKDSDICCNLVENGREYLFIETLLNIIFIINE